MTSRTLPYETEDAEFWMEMGRKDLMKSLSQKLVQGKARNVIIFIGDGMGMSTVTATRILKGQREGKSGEEQVLSFEKFPTVGLIKTYNVNKQVPDSAGTATAIFTGVKSNFYMLGYDVKAPYNSCDTEINKNSALTSLMQWAQDVGKSTGFVTTTRITHATPAALYSHVNHRDWECDGKIPTEFRDCTKDVARQLVEDSPGSAMKVILGGGWNPMGVTSEEDEDESCVREDGLNMVEDWELKRKTENVSYKYVQDTEGLMGVNADEVEYLLGIFSPGHMPYNATRDTSPNGQPSLAEMATKAVKMLQKENNGFVLMVEGGRIDHGHHDNYARLALQEAIELDHTISKVLSLIDPKETLIIVTADHSHAFTINGYPERGNDILGFANESKINFAYETLTYANGPSFLYHRRNFSRTPYVTWRDVSKDINRDNIYYRHFAPIYLEDETHAGEDVAVYAQGPYAHLLQGVHEQNYIAHVVSYAACIGPYQSHCEASHSGGERSSTFLTALMVFVIVIQIVI